MHQLIMPACLFIYRLYKKPKCTALLTGREEGPRAGAGGAWTLVTTHPPPGFGLLKQELGPGRPWALGIEKACFLGIAGILLPFVGAKRTMACVKP